MSQRKPKIIEINSVSRANYSSHRLEVGVDVLRLIPKWRSYFVDYFFKFGLIAMGLIFILFYLDGQMDLLQLAIILGVFSFIAKVLSWVFKRKYAHIIFDKNRDRIYNTDTSIETKLSDVSSVEILDRFEWGSLTEEHERSYRYYVVLLRSKSGVLYSVLSNAAYRDLEAIARDIANFIGVELLESNRKAG